MKYVFIVLIALVSGCATAPSEYNQGCRDGVSGAASYTVSSYDQKVVDKYCDRLDQAHNAKKRMERETGKN